MKKILLIVFLFVYTFTSVGYEISIHFCNGEISSVDVTTLPNKTPNCGCDENFELDYCCQTTSKHFQLDDEQKNSAAPNITTEKIFEYLIPVEKNTFETENIFFLSFNSDTSPHLTTSFQKLYCAYLI